MENFPIISVIIPVYNGEKRLPKCLGSIRKQSYPQDRTEFIRVDDEFKGFELSRVHSINVGEYEQRL